MGQGELDPLSREVLRERYAGPLIVGNDLMRFVVGRDVAIYRP